MVLAVQQWRPYLLGRQFLVCTDQKSLKHLLFQHITPDQQKWISRLLGYDFKIVYKPRTENSTADALSHRANYFGYPNERPTEFSTMSMPQWTDFDALAAAVNADLMLSPIVHALENGLPTEFGYSLSHGQLLYHGRLVLPAHSPWVQKFLAEFHATPVGGHSGYLCTYKRISSNLYWVEIKADVMKYVAKCSVCQKNKYLATSPTGLL